MYDTNAYKSESYSAAAHNIVALTDEEKNISLPIGDTDRILADLISERYSHLRKIVVDRFASHPLRSWPNQRWKELIQLDHPHFSGLTN